METTRSTQEVYQWKNHRVTKVLRIKLAEDRQAIIERLLAGQISQDNMGDKNFQLGRLDVINSLLAEDIFDDLKVEMENKYGKE